MIRINFDYYDSVKYGLEKYLFESDSRDYHLFFDSCIKGGHIDKHVCRSSFDLLDQIVNTPKDDYLSVFENEEEMYDLVINAIYSRIKTIATWVSSDSRDLSSYDYGRLDLHIDMKEPVGIGYSSQFEELQTNYLTLILARDFDSPVGFHVTTAYPNLDLEAIHTNRYFDLDTIDQSASNQIEGFNVYKEYARLKNEGEDVRLVKSKDTCFSLAQHLSIGKIVSFFHENSNDSSKLFYNGSLRGTYVDISKLIGLGYEKEAKKISEISGHIANPYFNHSKQDLGFSI